MIGLEAMLRLFTEQEANEKAFTALTRFLDALDEAPVRPGSRAALDPVVLSFQLKLLWVSGYMPHLETCVECGVAEPLGGVPPCGRRRRLRRLRPGRHPALAGRRARHAAAAPLADRGRGGRRPRRPGAARRARGRDRVVRAPRWLPAEDRLGLGRAS